MTSKIYSGNPKETASLRGIPVPDSFYKDHPQWDNANVKIEVLSDNTLLVRLVSENEDEQEEEDPEMLRLFLDALMADVIKDPSILVPYTEEMKAEADALLEGVIVEE
jgi:antitoxin PrlF